MIPPLRERVGDAVLLARHFLAPVQRLAAAADQGLQHGRAQRPRRLCLARQRPRAAKPGEAGGDHGRGARVSGPRISTCRRHPTSAPELDLRTCREHVERTVLHRALARADGNLSLAARLIGVSRPTLYDLLRQHGMRDLAPAPLDLDHLVLALDHVAAWPSARTRAGLRAAAQHQPAPRSRRSGPRGRGSGTGRRSRRSTPMPRPRRSPSAATASRAADEPSASRTRRAARLHPWQISLPTQRWAIAARTQPGHR